ncbi:MAG: Gfo/Idh/MocA family oxidoreductase [Sedimentisphaerales bacterium]|nr:Gfo/Idh/MocA family oxidoreductase [Sedimentisphaerales bacterium]
MQERRLFNRRRFLSRAAKAAAVSVSFPQIIQSSALGRSGSVAPSNRISIGCIGLGIQGTGNMREFLRQPDVHIGAVCDVRRSQCEKAKQIVDKHYSNQDCRMYGDFRAITRSDEVDAVLIATPDHWHVLMGLDAARNGKHMYYEKPIGWSFVAGQMLRDTVKRYGVVFQFGTQQRSSRDFRYACELVRNGRIGKLHTILVGVPGSVAFPDLPAEPIPDGLDYDMWLGPAPWAPHSFERCRPYTSRPNEDWTRNYSLWYHISDYCIGFIGNWGIHHMDIAQWAAGTEETGPVEVEGKGEFPTDGIADCAITWQVENTFANGLKIIHMDNVTSSKHPDQVPGFGQGVLCRGSEGWVFVNRSKLDAHPKSLLASTIGPNEIHLHESSSHHRDFLEAVKTGQQTACPIDVAVRSNRICQIDDIAIRLGGKHRWDPQKETFIGNAEANRMLTKSMRSPWHL